jgi:hypothetical protein
MSLFGLWGFVEADSEEAAVELAASDGSNRRLRSG